MNFIYKFFTHPFCAILLKPVTIIFVRPKIWWQESNENDFLLKVLNVHL